MERVASTALAKVLNGQLRDVVRRLRAGQSIEEITASLGGTDQLRQTLQRLLFNAVDLGVRAAESQLTIGIDWTLANSAARDWAASYAYDLVHDINATSQRVLQKYVSERIQTGEPLSTLVNDLEPYFGKRRAELIASTETTRAYAVANMETFRQNGVEFVRWNTANDELVCPVCRPLNGVVVQIGAAFQNGIQHPPAHPRCRCWVTPSQGD